MNYSQVWWHMPLITALGRQRQRSLCDSKDVIHSKFLANSGYWESLSQKIKTKMNYVLRLIQSELRYALDSIPASASQRHKRESWDLPGYAYELGCDNAKV